MRITVYTINAFAKTKEGGNPAGVYLNADKLTEDEMLRTAKKVGFSETAFVMRSDVADYKVRFFTTTDEVDLCGHATIGTFSLMKELGLLLPGDYTQETRAGILKIYVSKDGAVMMEQTRPQFLDYIAKEEIAESLNMKIENLDEVLIPQMVSTGLKDIMVPVKNKKVLDEIRPDTEKVVELCRKYDAVGYHMFAPDTLYEDTAYCRNIAPLYGIPEEAATGTSNGALACYLTEHKNLTLEEQKHMVFEQGYYMGRPSEIKASVIKKEGKISEVFVGGVAKNIQEKVIEI